jgi:glutamate formiminotransferase/formiminotetrahydrofolate cyclodeaminase
VSVDIYSQGRGGAGGKGGISSAPLGTISNRKMSVSVSPDTSNLVECVPNFSEGRDRSVIDRIVNAIGSVDGVRVLHSDVGESANRTVVTFVGEPAPVEEAAYRGIEMAADAIDMQKHSGTHPRIGCTDVCPFVPIGTTSIDDCIAIAERVGDRVGRELAIPVYLYAEAARHEGRRSLPAIRRGEYEGLAGKVGMPEFAPDYGPASFNARSGATAIGARRFLIAWNVNLNTKDVDIAREIARRLRTSGKQGDAGERIPGRFRGLQGDGWFIDEFDRAQVTFNILDHQTTPLASVFEACKVEADSFGVEVTGSELVGLVPKEALVEVGRHYETDEGDERTLIAYAIRQLGLDQLNPFDPDKRVLEFAYEGQ